ncbi:hypothetical protein RN001_011854 [Aquatica leii]|uniref:Protein deadpan n=1 Tax=Aquatica leii TaxID=1421715 RepID=A0AAN7SD14_9COLE|nr:hypothetical protein RN001_011854 [Aquatica leii]
MSRRALSHAELLKELKDLPQYESDCELPSNNNNTDEDSDLVIDVPESQKPSSDLDKTTSRLSTLTRRNSITDIATTIFGFFKTILTSLTFPMPISEDEYDSRPSFESSSTMSKAELRKTHKPIMEKRRRARINHCLNEIKTLILDAMKKDPARHSKLEKADILEMAVKHLQNVQRQQLALAMASDPSVLRKFKAGFNECAEEVNRYISNLEGLDANIQQRISSHLSKCISGIEQIVHLNFPGFGGVPFLANTNSFFPTSSTTDNVAEAPGDQNNNPSIQIPQSLQVIPSRLPTGEFALLLPNSNNLPYFPTAGSPSQQSQSSSTQEHVKSTRPSAFVTVIPSAFNMQIPKTTPTKPPLKLLSPPQSPSSSSGNLPQDEDTTYTNKDASSPRGFRPVHPSQRLQFNPLPQRSADVQTFPTSTSSSEASVSSTHQTEVKTIRFPIQKFASPQKLAEPLSIITNQSERYKQAQMLNDTSHYEENLQRGLKRKSEYSHSGLLTVALPSSKIMKTYHDSNVGDVRVSSRIETTKTQLEFYKFHDCEDGVNLLEPDSKRENKFEHSQMPSTSQSSDRNTEAQSNSDMWRPW